MRGASQLRLSRDHRRDRLSGRWTSGALCGPAIDFVHNARFAATNSLYSLWLARELLRDGFVVLNCDVLFHPQLLRRSADGALRGRAAGARRRATTTRTPTKR